jgi:mono/diheme cytochrome c family protein
MGMLTLLLVACAHTPDPDAGAAVYDRACSSCHGADGTAGVQVNGVPAADLSVVVPTLSEEDLTTIVDEGSGEMPPVSLDPDDVADCVAYVTETFGG